MYSLTSSRDSDFVAIFLLTRRTSALMFGIRAIRAAHLDGRRVAPGEEFYFDLNLFDLQSSAIPYFALAFAQLASEGVGPGRSRAELLSVRYHSDVSSMRNVENTADAAFA